MWFLVLVVLVVAPLLLVVTWLVRVVVLGRCSSYYSTSYDYDSTYCMIIVIFFVVVGLVRKGNNCCGIIFVH